MLNTLKDLLALAEDLTYDVLDARQPRPRSYTSADLDDARQEGYDRGFDNGKVFARVPPSSPDPRGSYDDGYDEGYRDAYDEAYYEGHAAARPDAEERGYDKGFKSGYEQGQSDKLDEIADEVAAEEPPAAPVWEYSELTWAELSRRLGEDVVLSWSVVVREKGFAELPNGDYLTLPAHRTDGTVWVISHQVS